MRESPNSKDDVYTGVTGWALYVYRLRNAEQLGELVKALGEERPDTMSVRPCPRLLGDAPS